MRSLRTAMKCSPHSLQLEKARVQQQRPNAAKKKKKKNKTPISLVSWNVVINILPVKTLSVSFVLAKHTT